MASALALAAATAPADAAFSLNTCGGAATSGRGASFQASAQTGFIANFQTSDFCGAGAPGITYDPAGSGAGRRSLGERSGANALLGLRDPAIRFGGTDEPPTPTQTDQMQQGEIDGGGADVRDSDDGILHVVPVAIGANAITVNYPNGCTIPAASLANAASADQTDRVKLPSTQIEAAMYADSAVDTWGELVPGITGVPTDAAIVAAGVVTCGAVPVRRVVRFDDSGTTFVQKDFLGKVNGARSPSWASFTSNPNTTWPNTVGASTAATCPVASNLCKNTSNGNGPLLDLMNVTDGAIGYSDVATARAKGFEMVPNTGDTTFWAPVVNNANTSFEPTGDATAFKSGVGVRGSNCGSVAFNNVPSATVGSWAAVSGTGNAAAAFYPACSLTYALVFDDNAAVYGNTAAEEARARTVKDYLTSQVSALGQSTLAPRDYSPLSPVLRTIAQDGVSVINWNKAGAGGGGGTPPPPPPPPPPPAPGGGAAPVAISNVFTIPKLTTTSTTRAATIVASVQVPGAGKLTARGTSSYKTKVKNKTTTKKVTLGNVTGTVTAAGTVKLTIKVGAAGRAALKKAKRLTVKVAVTYSPTGGTPRSLSKNVTLRAAKAAAKK